MYKIFLMAAHFLHFGFLILLLCQRFQRLDTNALCLSTSSSRGIFVYPLSVFSVFLFYPGLNFKVGGSVESAGSDAKGEKIRLDCQKLLGSGVCLSVSFPYRSSSVLLDSTCSFSLGSYFFVLFPPVTASFSLSSCLVSHQIAPLLPHQSTLQLFADSTLLSTSFSFFSKSTCLLCHLHQYYKGIFLIDARSHTTLCENSFMMFEHKTETCVCHHINAGIRTRETENALRHKGQGFACVLGRCVRAQGVGLQGVMNHKEGEAYRRRPPLLFIQENNQTLAQIHTANLCSQRREKPPHNLCCKNLDLE